MRYAPKLGRGFSCIYFPPKKSKKKTLKTIYAPELGGLQRILRHLVHLDDALPRPGGVLRPLLRRGVPVGAQGGGGGDGLATIYITYPGKEQRF